jgi:hypothetical protein
VEYHAGAGGTGPATPAGPAIGADPVPAGQPAGAATEQAQAGRTS